MTKRGKEKASGRRPGSAAFKEAKEAAVRVKASWDVVLNPQGEAPYFACAEGEAPEFAPEHTEFKVGNAWYLSELSRLIYLPGGSEGKKDSPLKEARRRHLEEAGLREVAAVNRRSNHATVFESEAGGGCTVVCFRGTMSAKQWLLNLTTIPISLEEGSYVHQGFKILFEEIWPMLLPHVKKAKRPLIYTGHSLGGALANLAASRHRPDAVYTFGAPRVGNSGFCELVGPVPIHRVVNSHDIVTLLPHSVETLAPYDFHHAGLLHYMTTSNEMLIDPQAEELPKESSERARQPLTFLVKSFTSPEPPGCLVDHLPMEYTRRLEAFL